MIDHSSTTTAPGQGGAPARPQHQQHQTGAQPLHSQPLGGSCSAPKQPQQPGQMHSAHFTDWASI